MKTKTLGDRIRAAREAAGMTQVELAGKVGVSQRGISHLETTCDYEQVALIGRVAKALGTTAGKLIGE